MQEIEIIKRQTSDVYQWTNRFLESVPLEKWENMPDVLNSTVSWQAGHLIVSHYFHTVWSIAGMHMDILQQMPFKAYGELFTAGSPADVIGKFAPEDLLKHLKMMQQKSLDIISSLSDEVLDQPLEPTPVPNPVAKTKRQALEWNIHHTMYHNGQIGTLNRAVNQRFNFGLQA